MLAEKEAKEKREANRLKREEERKKEEEEIKEKRRLDKLAYEE